MPKNVYYSIMCTFIQNNNIIVCFKPNDKLQKTLGNHYETQEVALLQTFVNK